MGKSKLLTRYPKPIFIKDRDYIVAEQLIRREVGNNESNISQLLSLFRSRSGFFDAESFMTYLEYLDSKDKSSHFQITTYDENVRIIQKRTGVDTYEEAEVIMKNVINMTIHGEGNNIREYFIKSSKGYKECKTQEEKDNYVKQYY